MPHSFPPRRSSDLELRRSCTGDQAQTDVDCFAFDISTGARSRIQLPLGCSPSQTLGNGITGWSVARSQVFILATTVASASAVLLRVDLQTGLASTVIDEKATTCRYEPTTLMYHVPTCRILGHRACASCYSPRSCWCPLYRSNVHTVE